LHIIDALDVKVESQPLSDVEKDVLCNANESVNKLTLDEETKWAQRAKVKHIQGGKINKYLKYPKLKINLRIHPFGRVSQNRLSPRYILYSNHTDDIIVRNKEMLGRQQKHAQKRKTMANRQSDEDPQPLRPPTFPTCSKQSGDPRAK
jgi:hypothetical protein